MGINLSAKNLHDMLPEDYGKGNLSGEEVDEKNKLIKCLQEQGHIIETNLTENSFRNTNLIVIKKDITSGTRAILFFHYSKELNFGEGYYGFSKNHLDKINASGSEYYYLLLIYDRPDEEAIYFAIPISLLKRLCIGNHISVSEDGCLKLNFRESGGRYFLQLKKKRREDISEFRITIKDLFGNNLTKRYDEEKEKYEGEKTSKGELLRTLIGQKKITDTEIARL